MSGSPGGTAGTVSGARTTGVSQLEEAFAAARREKRAALIGYLPAGFPSGSGCVAALRAMVRGGSGGSGDGHGGVDIVEVGLPYSDPLMDGPTIQQAVDVALSQPTHVADVIRTVQAVAQSGVPTLVMTYWNPVEQYGPERFAAELAEAGGAGVITPDLTPEEAEDWLAACERHDLAPVFLVAPSSPEERLRTVAGASNGFVYVASTMGVTGARSAVSNRAEETVRRTRAVTELPLAVGLGVSTPEQAAEVAQYADGVIVGSAFVRVLLDAPSEAEGVAAAGRLAGDLAVGVGKGQQ